MALTGLAACEGGHDGAERIPSIELTPATDVSPASDVVEVELAASLAQIALLGDEPAEVWAYRDAAVPDSKPSIPGPLIEARAGDRVIVHFRNELSIPTTIHWHGLRVPPMSDGTPVAQTPVPPGGEFVYGFVAEDAGTFWYHPHVDSDIQIEQGLYGALVVHDGAELAVDADRVLVLDDVKLEATGQLSKTTEQLDVMLGRQGNVLLVNGRERPTFHAKAGGRERWRFINTANGRYFNLRLPGHSFLVIGWDGGLLPIPYLMETLLVVPGERYDVLVEPNGEAGTTLSLQTVHYDRGHDIPDTGAKDILSIELDSGGTAAQTALPATWGEPVELGAMDSAVERKLVLTEEERDAGEPRFLINDAVFPDVPPMNAVSGDVEVWSVKNDTEMDHPFHLHGMFFRILDVDGVPPEHQGWKDTVNIPQRATLRFAVRYGMPGNWMFHCHILEHAERGMMGELVLAPRP